MPEPVVDLTLSDSDDESRRAPKRRRTAQTNLPSRVRRNAPAARSIDDEVLIVDDENDVVEVVEPANRPQAGPGNGAEELGDDEDIVITGLTGQVRKRLYVSRVP